MNRTPADGFSIHPDTRIGAVSLVVADLRRALGFYVDALGLTALQRHDDTVLLGVGTEKPIIELAEKANARPKPRHTTGLYHYAILLPSRVNLAQSLRRLAGRSYPLQGVADHGVSEALYLSDPDRNGIEIYIDRPIHDWPRRDGQLQMVTDPLDVEGLLSLDDGAWTGLPPGTRIGHIHLHVADLKEAEWFYGDLLGFDLMQRYGPSALFLSAGGYHHHIGLNTWAGVGAPPPAPDVVGLRHFTVQLPAEAELKRVAERLQAAKIVSEQPPSNAQSQDGLYVRDPSGNGIVLTVEKRKPL